MKDTKNRQFYNELLLKNLFIKKKIIINMGIKRLY